jgi:hypothetical protein
MGIIVYLATWLHARLSNERGQDLLEYAVFGSVLATALIAVGLVVMDTAIQNMGLGIGRCIDFNGSTPCSGL